MNATGMNTAMMVKVVAMTARPISAVPSRAAVRWSLPCCMCRTMFSRTTIASSISMPMASDRPISVRTLSVKPNIRIAMKAATTEIGSVSPVITVDRHELRNRKTMKTVNRPPSTSVTCTSSIESRMNVESSRTTCSETPGGSSGDRRATASRMPSATPTVLAPACFCTSSAMAGRSSTKAALMASSTPSITWPRSLTSTVRSPTRLTGISAICAADDPRAATRTIASVAPRSAVPTGASTF